MNSSDAATRPSGASRTDRPTAAPSATIDLPGEDVFPEGIALHPRERTFFVSGARSGAIYRGDLRTGKVEVLVPGEDREPLTTIGLDLDENDDLWVAGGASGKIFVFEARSGEQKKVFSTPASDDTFINDIVCAPSGDVYATDSIRPMIFRVRYGADEVESWLPLTGTAFESAASGSDANGIVVTPDERYLIAVKTGTGQLFRIEIGNGEVREIDLHGERLTHGDGLVLEERRLYVVRSADRQVDVVDLAVDLLSGRVAATIIDPSFEFPTTAAKWQDELLVVNSQFDRMEAGTARLPFRVSRVSTGRPADGPS